MRAYAYKKIAGKYFFKRIFQKTIAYLAFLCYNALMEILTEKIALTEGVAFTHCHFEKPKPDDIISTHLHSAYELLFFYDGDADYSIAGSTYHLNKNDLLLIKPSIYHNLILLSSHAYERSVSHFLEEVIPPDLVEDLKGLGEFYHVEKDSPLENLLNSLRSSQSILSEEEFYKYQKTILPLIIVHLKHIDKQTVKEKLPVHSTIQKILSYIDENPMQPLSLSSLSQIFYLSESHIAHLFKQHLNTSATQYINRKKILYAQSLITSGIMPAQVAEMCSYESYATFYRQYKKHLGVSPMHDLTK